MAFGKIKADAIIRDNSGTEEEVTMASLVAKAGTASPTFTGTVNLPATTNFAAASTFEILDNNANAFQIDEGTNNYVNFNTTNDSEEIEVRKKVQLDEDLEFSAAKDILIPDNNSAGLEIKEGSNAYMTFVTTNSSEKVSVQKAFDCDSTLNVDGVSTLNDHLNLTAQKELRLQDSSGGQFVAIKAPATVSSNVTLTLPANDGDADQVLTTNGSGTLSWAAASGGKVLQVLQAYKQDVFTTSASGTTDVTGLSVNITPSATGSKILVIAAISGHSHSGHGAGPLVRRVLSGSTTNVGQATADGSRHQGTMSGTLYTGDGGGSSQITLNSHTHFLDSPSTTSQITYKVSVFGTGSSIFINRTEGDGNSSDNTRTTSHITVMEIAE